ncbi:MAG: cytochrome c biogenesis protein CcsA [Vicinamibacterales bacterium]
MSKQGRSNLVPGLLGVAAVMFAASPFLIDAAPYESTMGLIQRIFYYHVPSAMVMFVSAFVCGIASAMYLSKRSPQADAAAMAAAELVVVFGLIVLVTGPIWAKKAWGVWWQWDARLTSALVLWLIFVSYLMLRRFAGAGAEVLAAAVGVFGMANVPFVYWSVNVWRTIHPTTNVLKSLIPEMRLPFYWCVGAFMCLYVALLMLRIRLERSRMTLDSIYAEIED